MTEHLTLKGHRALPDVRALGFDWKALQKVLTKHQRIWAESREIDAEFVAADREVGELERRSLGEMTEGILSGTESQEAADALPAAREKLEELRQRSLAYSGALEKLHREIVGCAEEHAEEYAADVRAKATEQLAEVEATVAHLRQLVAGLHVLSGVADWLERPKKSFSYTQPEGGMFAGILAEARTSKALPQEKRPEAMGIQHPGHTAPKGGLREVFAPFSR